MPEGPEIRRAADKIAAIVEGKQIQKVKVGLASLKPYVSKLTGRKVSKIETRGKAFITHFDNGLSIYSHNQLYGVWRTSKLGKEPDTNRSLRLALYTKTHSAILYSASDISVWETEKINNQPLLKKLGPDILNHSLKEADIVFRLLERKFANRALASLFLDQSFLAGLGNYLRSEILFFAGVHFDKKPKQLNEEVLYLLAKMTLDVSKRSYLTGGYTIDTTMLKSIATAHSDFEGVRFMVFDREGLPCRICGNDIKRTTKNSRRIYWCQHCQRN